jgi:membrane protein DedA with SNARE-associated domain
VLGLLAAAESAAFVGLAVPGETAMLLGGFLASRHHVSLPVMMAAGAVGAVVGDSVGYELGRLFGAPLKRSRLGRRVGQDRWAKAEAYLRDKGGRAVFLGRFVGVLRALVPALAGMSRMPYRTFLPWNLAGGIIWAPGFVLLGYLAGGSYRQVERLAGRASLLLLLVIVLVGTLVAGARWVARHPEHVRTLVHRQLERPVIARLQVRYQSQLAFLARRLRPGGAVGLSLTITAAGLAGAGWAFGAVLQDVLAGDEGALLDGPVHRFLVTHREAWLTPVMRAVTELGNAAVLAGLILVAGLAWWWRRRTWRPLGLLAGAYLGAWVLAETVKALTRRPRPPASQAIGHWVGSAFPSGHTGRPPRSTACSPPWRPRPTPAGPTKSPHGRPRSCSSAWSACRACIWVRIGSPTSSAGARSARPGCLPCSPPPVPCTPCTPAPAPTSARPRPTPARPGSRSQGRAPHWGTRPGRCDATRRADDGPCPTIGRRARNRIAQYQPGRLLALRSVLAPSRPEVETIESNQRVRRLRTCRSSSSFRPRVSDVRAVPRERGNFTRALHVPRSRVISHCGRPRC